MPLLTRDWSVVTKVAPELFGVVGTIERWLKEKPTIDHIEPGRLIQVYTMNVDRAVELYRALEIARDRRLVKRSWGVFAPRSRCHALGYWDKLSRIPKRLYDTADEPFKRSEGEFFVLYRHPDAEEPDGP